MPPIDSASHSLWASAKSGWRAGARSSARHPLYADAQRERLAESIGGNPAGAARRGAEAILGFLAKNAGQDKSGE